jgi:hypothetical protein
VQADIRKGVLKVIRQEVDAEAPAPPPLEVAAEGPLPQTRGSHPVEEEGSVNIAEFKKARKGGKRSAKETKA